MQQHREPLDTDELPIVLESTQKKYVAIEDGECGNCGYDRIKVVHQKLGGVTKQVCKNCKSRKDEHADATWERPTRDSDRLKYLRKWADTDGTIVKHGEFGPRSRYTHGHEVFGYDDGTGLFKVYRHGRNGTNGTLKSFREDTFRGMMKVLESDVGYVTEWLKDELNPLERAVLATEVLPEQMTVSPAEDDE